MSSIPRPLIFWCIDNALPVFTHNTASTSGVDHEANNGEIPQYYVEEHHEAIIPPAQFDFVQAELVRREQNGR